MICSNHIESNQTKSNQIKPMNNIDIQIESKVRVIATWFMLLIFNVPWLIAYFNVMKKVNENECANIVYNFGTFANWSYSVNTSIICTIGSCAVYYVLCCEEFGRKIAIVIMNMIQGFTGILSTGEWIYGVVALINRSDCKNDAFIVLIWTNVMFPVVVLAFITCCICCFYCVALMCRNLLHVRRFENDEHHIIQETS